MSKKLLISLAVICVLILAFVGINLKKDNVIRIAAAGYPMDEIVKIAAEDLKKEGYSAFVKDKTLIVIDLIDKKKCIYVFETKNLFLYDSLKLLRVFKTM